MGTFNRFRQNLKRTPILYRIAIGNAVVIAIGAVGGTYITRLLADRAADWWLILIFLGIGTTLSVVMNFWIIKNALRPLTDLSARVVQVQNGDGQIDPQLLGPTDPDVYQLAATLDSLVKQLNERNQELRALSERAINALEEERKQIALTLHDDTGQSLSMLIINLERLEDHLPENEDVIKEKLVATRELAQETLSNLRKIVYGLRPSILDDLGLIPAIRWYARTNLEEAGMRLKIDANGDVGPLPSPLNSTLFRIAQEAINNILRHSQAKIVVIKLSKVGDQIQLEVQDDGKGFDLNFERGEALQQQHLGLLGMQERAELVGGSTWVSSLPGRGTQIRVNVPYMPPGGVQIE
ncbi:MAG: sensor histidine kinase [Chloroflexota bacterium]|nr:MAG: sensor histidine kinase [Chloroflexota bacterium]